jgi:hypothetical protein
MDPQVLEDDMHVVQREAIPNRQTGNDDRKQNY